MKSKTNKESRMRPEPPVAEMESGRPEMESGRPGRGRQVRESGPCWVGGVGCSGGGTVGGVDPGGTDRKWSLSHRL